MKVVVIGCTHAGTAAIVNTCKLYKDAQITVYERNDNISFLSCGIALTVSGVVKEMENLFYNSPEKLALLGVTTKMQHDVLSVDFDNKKLTIKNILTGEEFDDTYDKLIITTGSWPILPKMEGSDLKNVIPCKNYNHAKEIVENAKDCQNIVIVGAGYIGVELFEAFLMLGKKVTIIDAIDCILGKYLDHEFSSVAAKELEKNGGNFALNECVKKLEGTNGKVSKVITDTAQYDADMVIMCIGFTPNTEIFKGKLDMMQNGSIIVNDYMQTSQKDVYSAGDCCSVKYNPNGKMLYIPLATNAVRMGTLVGINLKENKMKYLGTQGTSGIKIYDQNIATTGLTEDCAKVIGMDVSSTTITEVYRPAFMPTHETVTLKIVYDKNTHKLVGGQIMSVIDLTPAINTLSLAIQKEVTVEELAITDFFFQPHFNNPVNYLNSVAMKAMDNM